MLLAEYLAEVRGQVDDERRLGRLGLPGQLLGKDLRSLVLWAPPLDEPRVHVHDPILRHALSLVQPSLDVPVGTGGGGRQNLDDKAEDFWRPRHIRYLTARAGTRRSRPRVA